MKVRNGFVSNSSSSSFVCEVCGDAFESYDQGISDFGLVTCEDHDHLFCEAHRINPDTSGMFENYESDCSGDSENHINSKHCPICQLKEIPDNVLLQYALRKLQTNRIKMKKDITDTFKNYNELCDYTSGKQK
jgi:hypothetical protein